MCNLNNTKPNLNLDASIQETHESDLNVSIQGKEIL